MCLALICLAITVPLYIMYATDAAHYYASYLQGYGYISWYESSVTSVNVCMSIIIVCSAAGGIAILGWVASNLLAAFGKDLEEGYLKDKVAKTVEPSGRMSGDVSEASATEHVANAAPAEGTPAQLGADWAGVTREAVLYALLDDDFRHQARAGKRLLAHVFWRQ